MSTNYTELNGPVFIVDNHEKDRELIEYAFKKIFPSVGIKLFSNGMELVLELEKKVRLMPLFILMELNLPLINGFEALKWIRHHKLFKNVPVIIFSSSSNENDINRCYQFGANSYLIKPFEARLYENIVEGLKRFWTRT